MIVPMKKVSLVVLGNKKAEALKKLRELGILHIEISEGSGEKLSELKEQVALLESAVFGLAEYKKKNAAEKAISTAEALVVAKDILALTEDVIPPTINLNEPDPDCDLDYTPNTARQTRVTLALSNSLGFGGHNACLAFRRIED